MPSGFAEVSELLQDGSGHFHDYRKIFLGGKHRKDTLRPGVRDTCGWRKPRLLRDYWPLTVQ
jgi:hypothetical protein